MRKVLQAITVLGVLCFLSTATSYAETMGTNPRPRPIARMSVMDEMITAMTVFFAGI